MDPFDIEEKLAARGLSLPEAPAPVGSYLPYQRAGEMIYLAGTICLRAGVMTHTGPLGRDRTLEYGQEAAIVCTLNALANLREALQGDWRRLRQIVFVNGYVYGVPGFAEAPQVINAASDLLAALFGEKGCHARAAMAVAGLPKESTVELQLTALTAHESRKE